MKPHIGYIPPLDMLRQELQIQEQDQEILRHMAKNARPGQEKIKSQRGDVEIFVPHRVKWPHEFVLPGQDLVSYNQLSPIQCMDGYD